ncbi:acetamidase/formamidase family protein [Phytohabitans sp. ZYX-F-186]|uniref:Acetamidase/formamidase family protein n=1 Tax=Phytohabitans maris TaxID=3071409 RepID=A0ABU0ZAF2_9ACTN|nr:acetamidase/formamidase family protein [Phytohabitans sp. ZYX-F-186]MDQ7904035.1 acetamidase/formamidase family protein [Phytohabitans sp. ZYX-F-186]
MSTNHWSSASRRGVLAAGLAATFAAGTAGAVGIAAPAQASGRKGGGSKRPKWDHHLKSTPDNLHWGGFPIGWEPGVTMRSGQTVRVDTLSQQGLTNSSISPRDYFGAFGVRPHEVLPDAMAFWDTLPERQATGRQYGGHVLTGPIYVRGAEPGDTVAIDILDIDTRVPYGFNNTAPTGGVMATFYPGWREGDVGLDIPAQIPPGLPAGVWPDVRTHMYRVGMYQGKEVVFFADGIRIPTQKFMGIIAVASPTGEFIGNTEDAPPPATGVQNSTPPGKFGGNMDCRDLCAGTTLYLPVFQPGAQIFIGDPHSCQGDGEVSGTAVEHSLAGTFRITLVKNVRTELPWAENDDHWIMMGIHWDLDRAMRIAVEKTVDFLVTTQGLTVPKAYSFASIAVNYHNAEVVDRTQVVTGYIPKDVFKRRR